MWLFVLISALSQDVSLAASQSWESLAVPWMTRDEHTLYQSLGGPERRKFKGYFVARRLERPDVWPETGLYLPYFFYPQHHGDIRDQIAHLLGQPDASPTQLLNPSLPSLWQYGDRVFAFEPNGPRKVRLAATSLETWERLKAGMVKHPELRYDFHVKSFGRTRLPEDINWFPASPSHDWLVPNTGEGEGATLHVAIPIPNAFRQYLATARVNPIQNMELLVLLRKPGETSTDNLIETGRVRHASQRLDLATASHLYFETYLPPGYHQAEMLVYSGFLQLGLRATTQLVVLPPELPRIGDPIICEAWKQAGVRAPASPVLSIGDTFYLPLLEPSQGKPARVLVHSPYDQTELWLRRGSEAPVSLNRLERERNWFVFELPNQKGPFQLLALGFPPGNGQIALSATGPDQPFQAEGLNLKQASLNNYLRWEQLEIEPRGPTTLLFVNDTPLAATQGTSFSWPSMDWGREATVRFEYEREGSWRGASFTLKRNEIFQEIRVKPKFLVAATQSLEGRVEAVPFQVKVAGQPVEILKRTPLAELPKLWGIVVNDPLLKSPAWPMIRDAVFQKLKRHSRPRDLIYIVHNAHRPEMVLEPTTVKPLVKSSLDALSPKTKDENYFTVQYLIDALTHLKHHQTRAHQVLLLTNQLTDEIQQMENLIPKLRQTGLQIYNLEFPFEFVPESGAKLADVEADALDIMAAREQADQEERLAMRDNFQESRNVLASYGFVFGSKKAKRKLREEEILAQAAREAFNRQLANMSAGMAHASGVGETVQSLFAFFEKFGKWQAGLVHLQLPTPYLEEDLIRLQAPEGYTVSWTLVEWTP